MRVWVSLVASLILLHATSAARGAAIPCQNGMAGIYPCRNVDLMAQLPLAVGEIAVVASVGQTGNDVWGWTDPENGREYALVGLSQGTAFVDVTDPVNPVFVGFLFAHGASPLFPVHRDESDIPGSSACAPRVLDHECGGSSSLWRDLEVYKDHVFIGSEQSDHGLQVFDLTQLRNPGATPKVFSETAYYDGFGNSHTITINTETGFLYANGTSRCGAGAGREVGPHIVDIRDPEHPTFAGCVGVDGYTHDAQCVLYHGPDADHPGAEICMNCNEDTLTIVDTTDKANPVMLSRTGYPNASYTHQGWLTADHQYYLLDDELDETGHGLPTSTYIWDVRDLDAPRLIGVYSAATMSIDHQMFIHNGLAYQTNYMAGLRVLNTKNISIGQLSELAFFDVVPGVDVAEYGGTWANYPFFKSGTVVANSIEDGLFILRPTLTDLAVSWSAERAAVPPAGALRATATVANQGPTYGSDVVLTITLPAGLTGASVTSSQGSCSGSLTLTCALGKLPNQSAATVTIQGTAPATLGPLSLGAAAAAVETDYRPSNNTASVAVTVSDGLGFYTATPCRVYDSRSSGGALAAGAARTIAISSTCGVPATAKAVALTATIIEPSGEAALELYPQAGAPPTANTVSAGAGQTRAGNVVIGLAPEGSVQVYAAVAGAGATHFALDVAGWFE